MKTKKHLKLTQNRKLFSFSPWQHTICCWVGYYIPSLDPITYTVSGWAKGTGQSYAATSLFGIRIKVKYHDGSTDGITETFNFRFDKGITDWQFISGGFTTNPEKGLLESITIMLMYNDHSGDGYFDSISLIQDNSATNFYEYNALGYLSSYQSGRHTTWYKYNDNNNVIVAISSNKTIVEYEYDSSNRVIEETHSRYTGFFNPSSGRFSGEVTELYYNSYIYDSYGMQLCMYTYDLSDTTKSSYSITTYNTSSGSHIFGTVSTETDPLGNTTRYFYNTNNGRLLASIYPEGNGVSYQYDAVGNLTMVTPAEISATNGYVSDLSGTAVTYGYDSTTNRLNTITTKPTSSTSTTYTFAYDVFGNTSSISVGSRNLASYTYNSNNGKLNTLTYGNGHKVKYVYDILDRISEVQYNIGVGGAFETVYSYTYDSAGNVYSVTDHVNGEVTLYKYDALGKLVDSNVYDSETYLNLSGTTIYYNDESKISMVFYGFDYDHTSGTMYDSTSYSYTYNATNGNIEKLTVSGGYISGTINPVYDNFGRTSTRTIDFNVNSTDAFYNKLTYDYKTNGNNESALVSEMNSEVRKGASSSVISSTTYKYVYDANGNITQITNSAGLILNKYYYDDLNQLIREDNRSTNHSYVYEYDNAGNITAKKTYVFTTGTLGSVLSTVNYTYGDSSWKDLLTKYGSTTITYDSIGNPLTIGSNSLTWQGRQLKSWYDGSNTTINYGYNADGIRTYKEVYDASTATTTRHEYLLSGSQIVKETVYVNGIESYTLVYLYDETGSPIGYRYRTPSYASGVFDGYFYEKNLQGDIVKVFNQSGTQLANYIYDAWGNPTITYLGNGESTPAKYNPFAYRGYYLDSETGLYYLQSRYYNPVWGRFISTDNAAVIVTSPMSLMDKNLYAYCDNNPIMRIDEDGDFWNVLIGVAVGVAGQFISDCISSAITGEFELSSVSTYLGAAIGGAITNAIGVPFLGDAVGSAVSTVITMVGDNIETAITGKGEMVGFEEMFYTTTNSAIFGGLSSFMPDAIKSGDEMIESVFNRKTISNAVKQLGIDFVNCFPGSAFSAFTGVVADALPSTHIWD